MLRSLLIVFLSLEQLDCTIFICSWFNLMLIYSLRLWKHWVRPHTALMCRRLFHPGVSVSVLCECSVTECTHSIVLRWTAHKAGHPCNWFIFSSQAGFLLWFSKRLSAASELILHSCTEGKRKSLHIPSGEKKFSHPWTSQTGLGMGYKHLLEPSSPKLNGLDREQWGASWLKSRRPWKGNDTVSPPAMIDHTTKLKSFTTMFYWYLSVDWSNNR